MVKVIPLCYSICGCINMNRKVERTLEINTLFEIINHRKNYKENSENGLVILINGPWGSGKSEFLRDFMKHLQKKEEYSLFNYYDSYQYDFYDNAYIPFFSSISEKLDMNYELEKIMTIASNKTKNIVLKMGNEIIKDITKIDFQEILKKTKEAIDEDKVYLKDFYELKELKKKVKDKMTGICKDKVHIFIIDELDRCNPKFSIDTLEIVKHFFDIENCIFIIAVDKKELKEEAKTIFGQKMNAEIYFSKFFDYQFNLNKLTFFETLSSEEIEENKEIIYYATEMFNKLEVSLRDSKKIFNDFLGKKQKFETEFSSKWIIEQKICILFLIILKYTNLTFYNAIMENEYELYKNISEQNLEEYKYYKILNMKFDKKIVISDFLRHLSHYINKKYIDTKNINTMSLLKEQQNLIEILEKMYIYVPRVLKDGTYCENLRRIVD